MSQGKAKKKLQYNQDDDKCRSHLKIKDVFTLRDIDTLFDDIDADSELDLPLLSPLPMSSGVNTLSEQVPKVASKQKQIKANGIQDDKESQFKKIAPLKTSSPIALATEGAEAVDGIRPMADPLFFGEDEEPIGEILSNRLSTQQSEPLIKSHHSDSGSLASPPERFELRKTAKPTAGSLSRDKDPSPLSPVMVQKNEQKLPESEQCMDKMEETGKGLSFQHKLKKALMPKSPCSRKPAAAPPPVDLEEDFMILDDEAPVRFIIPRKTEVNRNKRTVQAKTSKGSVPAEPHSTHQLSQSEEDRSDQQGATSKRNPVQIEPGKKQMKGKRGKASKKTGKGAASDVLEDRTNPVSEELQDEVCDGISQTIEGLKDLESAGKQSTEDKEPEELPDTAGEDTDSHHIPVPPVSRTTKKSSKSSGSQQKRPETKAKKEPNKDSSTAAGPHATKSNKNRKNSRNGESVYKTNKRMLKRQMEPEKIDAVCEEHDGVEPPPALHQLEDEQRTAVNKQSSTKRDALKNPAKKQKGKETQKTEPKPKNPPAFASDSSSDGPMISKRMRKPPGAWWLTSQDESTAEGHSESKLGIAQGPKTSTKTPTKQAAVKVFEETQSSKPAQAKRKKLKTSHNEVKSTRSEVENAEKVICGGNDAEAQQKKTKKAGGKKTFSGKKRKKTKPAATKPQVPSPAPVYEEEVEVTSDKSPVVISPEFSYYRQHNPVAGKKQIFDKVYAHDSGTAPKQSSSSPRRPESSGPNEVPLKRQRKANSNWWELPQSQEPTNGPLSPPSPPPQKSKAPNAPVPGATSKTSQKTKNRTRNVKRNIISTPKSIKRSLASMNAIFASEKVNVVRSGQRHRKQGRRNILHSLEDQSDHSSENMAHSDDQMQGNGHISSRFTNSATAEPLETRNRMSARVSSGPNTLSDVDVACRSGPSSMLALQQHDEEDANIDLPSSRATSHVRRGPRVLSQCDLCAPPLQTVVLEEEDWSNLHAWFSHLWPPASKEGRVISPDDFHWHSYGGRAMGHAVDLQSSSFSHGKILLGSFMKKPPHIDHDTVSVFSIISSCVRVDISGERSVYNSGQVFMIPSGRVYSIHNLCQEPAVLIYHRTQC